MRALVLGQAAVLAAAIWGAGGAHAAEPHAAVAASKPGGNARCGAMKVVGADVRGGCVVDVFAESLGFTLLTMFGNSRFATCDVPMKMHVDGRGRFWIEEVYVQLIDGACADIQSCRTRLGDDSASPPKVPWRGRFEKTPGGGVRADVDVCFDTCAGRFEGGVRLDVSRGARYWRLRADSEGLGATGLEIDATWLVERKALDLGAPTADPVATADPAATFAPLVLLAREEKWLPTGARWFVDRSALWFGDDRSCGDRKVAVGRALRAQRTGVTNWIFASWLGSGGRARDGPGDDYHYSRYPREPGSGCRDSTPHEIETTQRTRPFDRTGRPAGLRPREGFYLDLMDWARRGGTAERAPAYVERDAIEVGGEPGTRLTYWLLYGMNAPPGRRDAVHEGDWERVEVILRDGDEPDRHTPLAVRFRTSGRRTGPWRPRQPRRAHTVPWRALRLIAAGARKGGTHPVLRAASGGHDLSAARGDCGGCAEWRTWTRLRDARRQPWYGFGGAWGDIGRSSSTTGPLGPR